MYYCTFYGVFPSATAYFAVINLITHTPPPKKICIYILYNIKKCRGSASYPDPIPTLNMFENHKFFTFIRSSASHCFIFLVKVNTFFIILDFCSFLEKSIV